MPETDLRGRLLAECANHIWALRPEAIAVVRSCAAGALTTAQALEQLGLQSVERDEPVAHDPIKLIRLHGLITPKGSFLDILFGGGGGLQAFRASLQEAVDDSSIDTILIDVDSPGGYHTLVPEAAAAVIAARRVKPVVAIANTMAASAAYYIASQADELVVTPSGVVGSIGVYSTHEDWSRFEDRLGVKTTLISAGPFKTEGNMFEPLGDDARANMQAEVDTLYEEFLEAVAAGRGTSIDDVREHYGQGRCLRADAAVVAGVVDSVETIDELIDRLNAGDVTRRNAAAKPPTSSARPPAPPARPAEVHARSAAIRHAVFTAALATAPHSTAGANAAAPMTAAQGIAWVTGSASVFGSRNTFGECFVPGAYGEAVEDTANPLPMVDMHRQAIGSWSDRTEDLVKLALGGAISDTQAGRDTATLLSDGALNGLSVGYLPTDVHLAAPHETVTFDTPYGPWSCTHDRWTLYVIRAQLAEVSIVYAPSDGEARVTSIGAMSAEQLGTALPGLRADASWEDVAWSMCRLMGAPGAGLAGLAPEERQALHGQLRDRYLEHGHAAPVFAAEPDYRSTTFHAGEPALYQDRSLGKRCADVVAATGGSTGRPLSDGTRTRAIEARDALARLLDPEQPPEDPQELDTAAVVAELERALTSLES